jgi:hypothetical protein
MSFPYWWEREKLGISRVLLFLAVQDRTCSGVDCFVPDLHIGSHRALIDYNPGPGIDRLRPAMGTCFINHITLVVSSWCTRARKSNGRLNVVQDLGNKIFQLVNLGLGYLARSVLPHQRTSCGSQRHCNELLLPAMCDGATSGGAPQDTLGSGLGRSRALALTPWSWFSRSYGCRHLGLGLDPRGGAVHGLSARWTSRSRSRCMHAWDFRWRPRSSGGWSHRWRCP